MSDSDDTITPFRLPGDGAEGSKESFGERLRRRRNELSSGQINYKRPGWQRRSRHLTAILVESPHAAASITRKSATQTLELEGIEAVLFSEDLPAFQNSLGREFSSEPLLAEDEVVYVGQPVAMIVGESEAICRVGEELLTLDYHDTPGVTSVDHAVALENFHGKARVCQRGDSAKGLQSAAETLEGSLQIASQAASLASPVKIAVHPSENGKRFSVETKALLPTSVKTGVAKAAGIAESAVVLQSESVEGLTDALELEPVRFAMLATRAALKCSSSITLLANGGSSPLTKGQRHTTEASFKVGFSKKGVIKAAEIQLHLDGGFFPADSFVALDRAVLHTDSVYAIPHLKITGKLCKTNHITSSSLPAEGSAQGAWVMEEIIQRVSEETGLLPREIREKNFYHEDSDLKTTPYGQPISAESLHRVWNQALRRSNYDERLKAVDRWNRKNPCYKRGIGIVPVKFGLGDPRPERDAGAVLLQILNDGSVLVRAGIVDVSDGLRGLLVEETALALGVEAESVEVVLNDFSVLPRATPVTGTDASGLALRALREASQKLQSRLKEVALQLFAAQGQTDVEIESIQFTRGLVMPDQYSKATMDFNEVIEAAWRKRINLVETGYFRTPNLWWDPELGAGWPFSSFTYAAAVTEIQVDAFTGEIQILRTDIAHEGSPSANQGDRDYAQLIRAYTMGAGWILSEKTPDAETVKPGWDFPEDGVLGFADAPFEVVTDRLRPLGDPSTIPGAPCSEAPLLLAASVREALWDALRAFGFEANLDVDLPLPATPAKVLATFKEISRQLREKEEA